MFRVILISKPIRKQPVCVSGNIHKHGKGSNLVLLLSLNPCTTLTIAKIYCHCCKDTQTAYVKQLPNGDDKRLAQSTAGNVGWMGILPTDTLLRLQDLLQTQGRGWCPGKPKVAVFLHPIHGIKFTLICWSALTVLSGIWIHCFRSINNFAGGLND